MGSKESLESRALSAKRERVEIIESPNHEEWPRQFCVVFVLVSCRFFVPSFSTRLIGVVIF